MNRSLQLLALLAWCVIGMARADSRAGSVVWSDGKKIQGAISLSPGKNLKLFTKDGAVSLQLNEVKEMQFKVEHEEMWEGYYFPNVGQATQVKTGEIYPIRYLLTDITLADGKVLEGHLFTTMLYVETEEATEKVALVVKQTGANGQKLADLPYPTDVRFDASAPAAGSSQIDLTQAGLKDVQQIVVAAKPELGLLPASQTEGKPIWSVPMDDPTQILFSVQAADGFHVAWPALEADPAIQKAVDSSIQTMFDFYDTRKLLGCFAENDGTDIYSLVIMKRVGPSYDLSADITPWSLVILRWKYDPDEKKTSLLNKVGLVTGRIKSNSPLPTVFKEAALLKDISVTK